MSLRGQLQGALNIATAGATPSSMYEPNQFVMNCGVIDPTAGPIRIYSPHPSYFVSLCVRYAITLN